MEALIIIDYTNDFVATNGVLSAKEPAQKIEGAILNLIDTFAMDQNYIVTATDTHEAGDVFHPEMQLFPLHNVEGTYGRQFYGKLAEYVEKYPQIYQMKKRHYSAFAGTELDQRLRERNILHIHLVGVCTDICVLHTAIDAYNLGYKITVYKDAVATFNPAGQEFSLKHMETILGARII